MFGFHLKKYYRTLRELGLARSERHFSRDWLGRGSHYLRNIEPRDRVWRRIAPVTTAQLRAHLLAVVAHVPSGVAAEIQAVIEELDRDLRVAEQMTGWR